MKLTVSNVICRLAKISNNTIMMGGNNFQPEFTIPFSGIMLDEDMLNTAMGDSLTWRSWYNHSPPALPTPCEWWAGSKGEFPISDTLEGEFLSIRFAGDRMLEFFAEEKGEGKEKTKTPAYKISKVVLIPRHGGLTEFKGNLHVRPGIGKENLLLQEHQHAEVRLSFSETRASVKNEKQSELDLEPTNTGQSMADFHRAKLQLLQGGTQRQEIVDNDPLGIGLHDPRKNESLTEEQELQRWKDKMEAELNDGKERAFGPNVIDGTGK